MNPAKITVRELLVRALISLAIMLIVVYQQVKEILKICVKF